MFSDPQVRRLAVVRWISMAGTEASFFVGVWGRAAFELGASPRQLSLVMAMLALSGVIGATAGGILVDRFSPRRVLVVGELVVVPSTLALLVPQTVQQLALAVAVPNAAAMAVFAAVSTFPALLTRDGDRLARMNAAVEVASTGAFVAGPAAGAVLAATVGVQATFVANAATSVVAAALGLGLPATGVAPSSARPVARSVRTLTAGLRFAYRTPRLRFVLGIGTITWLAFGTFGALEPLYFRDVLNAGPSALGWVNAVFGVGLAIGATVLSRAPRRLTTLPVAVVLATAGGLGAVLYTATASLTLVPVAAVGWGAVLGVLLPTLRTLVQRETPVALIGRTMGVVQLHERTGDLLPLAVAPMLAVAVGVQPVLVGSGVVVALLAALMLPFAARLERGRSVATADGGQRVGPGAAGGDPVDPHAGPTTAGRTLTSTST